MQSKRTSGGGAVWKRTVREYREKGGALVPFVVRKAQRDGVTVFYNCSRCSRRYVCKPCQELIAWQESSMPPRVKPVK